MSADRGVFDRVAPDPDATLSYGAQPHQVVDLYLPAVTPAPAWVVLVHGGFWRGEWDRTHQRPLADALRAQGYAVALLEYVRTGMAGGGWPGTFDDVADGLRAVREHAGHAGSGAPLIIVGHSAGGHLAVWALHQGAAAPADGLAPVAGAISLAGCLDLTQVAELGLDEDAAGDLMGGAPAAVPDRYATADPTLLGRAPAPVVVVHGTEDEQVPLDVAHAWWSAAADPGRDRLVVLEGVGHFPVIDPLAPTFEVLTDELRRLTAG